MSVTLIDSVWENGYLVFKDSSGNELFKFNSGGVTFGGTVAVTGAMAVSGAITTASVPVVAKTASYAVLAADSGKTFTTTGAIGAVEFTLPAVAAGLNFTFCNTVDQNMTVTATDKIVALHNAAADGVAYSTASEKIGGVFHVVCDGTKWLVSSPCANTVTVASA